jgi:Cu(I)/Ag(I) efflux system membrane fusion protein
MKTAAATFSALVLVGAGALAASQSPAASSTDALRGVVKTYLEIHALLTQDKFNDVKGPAGTLTSQTAALGKDSAELAKAATTFAGAKDVKSARDAFGPLSDALIARVKADGNKDLVSDLKVGYCPMNSKSWIQREESPRNPYYGTAMANCGTVKPVGGPAKPAK